MWCEALSSGGIDSPKPVSKNKSSQNPPRSGAFYISNAVESDSVNDFAVRRRLSFEKFRVIVSRRQISEDFCNFPGEFGRTATCPIDIRNRRGSFYPIVSGCCPDPLCIRVTGWVCSVEISRFGEFRKTGKLTPGPSPGSFLRIFSSLDLPSRAACLLCGVD